MDEPLKTNLAKKRAVGKHLLMISGHYEGIYERMRATLLDREILIGDYALTNGTLGEGVSIDVVARYVPGVLR